MANLRQTVGEYIRDDGDGTGFVEQYDLENGIMILNVGLERKRELWASPEPDFDPASFAVSFAGRLWEFCYTIKD